MMKVFISLLAAILLCTVQCYKRNNLRSRPEPMKDFDPNKVTGRWYYQWRLISCSFSGVREFTNAYRDVSLVEGQYFKISSTYRVHSLCSTLVDKRYFIPEIGNYAVQQVKDQIGNIYTGTRVITATDYDCFLVTWSCMKVSSADPNLCDDPALTIVTREQFPSIETKQKIDVVLMQQFELVTDDLEGMKHDNPC